MGHGVRPKKPLRPRTARRHGAEPERKPKCALAARGVAACGYFPASAQRWLATLVRSIVRKSVRNLRRDRESHVIPTINVMSKLGTQCTATSPADADQGTRPEHPFLANDL